MAGAASIRIELDGKTAGNLSKALRVLAEPDAPHLREALEEGGQMLAGATRSRAKGRIAGSVQFAGVKGKAHLMRATVVVKHPGAKPAEFGRQTYYRGFTGRRQKATGTPFKAGRGGQKAQPFVGIVKGGAALGAVEPRVRQLLTSAVSKEWDRLGGGS